MMYLPDERPLISWLIDSISVGSRTVSKPDVKEEKFLKKADRYQDKIKWNEARRSIIFQELYVSTYFPPNFNSVLN